LKKVGIIAVFIGLLIIIYSVFPFAVKMEGVDLEKLEIVQESQHTVNWLPYVGIGLLIIGSVVLVLGVNRKDEKEIFEK
jgi:membrane-associated HD superfamily phosphohydrolase